MAAGAPVEYTDLHIRHGWGGIGGGVAGVRTISEAGIIVATVVN